MVNVLCQAFHHSLSLILFNDLNVQHIIDVTHGIIHQLQYLVIFQLFTVRSER